MSVPRSRILGLLKLQCSIFRATFNPENLRLGNKVLRERLRGPSVASYYPARIGTIKQLRAQYPNFEVENEEEEERLEKVRQTRVRGKGPPKKKKSKLESKRFNKRKSAAAPPS